MINGIGQNPVQYSYSPARDQSYLQGNINPERFEPDDSFIKVDLSEKALKKLGVKSCETCENRKYQDSSDDPGVSFKTPARLSPDQAASAVVMHEREHVSHEQADAKVKGKEIVYQSVTIHTDVCPECGRIYVSGGETRTMTKTKPSRKEQLGEKIDIYA